MVVVFSPFIICFLLIFFHLKKLFKEQMRWDQSKSCLGKRFVLSTSLDTVSLKDKRLQPSLGQSKEITPELPYNSQYLFFVLFVCTLTPVSTVPCSLLNWPVPVGKLYPYQCKLYHYLCKLYPYLCIESFFVCFTLLIHHLFGINQSYFLKIS